MTLTLGSLFSGAGGFERGFEAAGFRTAWQCEIDQDATDVLERHWPDVKRYRDVREVDPAELEPVDVVVFGSPCQDMSVAGKRGGLAGERSGLFHEATRIISGLRSAPAFVIWENVPGALSSSGGRDFGVVLDSLADIGALDIAWRVLDAQWFGVPQRRRRIFLVADFGGERAASVLFESESVRGHPSARREARQGAPRDAENGAGSGGGPFGIDARNGVLTGDTTMALQGGDMGGERGLSYNCLPLIGEAVAHCLTDHGGSHGRIDAESETFVVASAITASAGHHGHSSPCGDGADNLVPVGFYPTGGTHGVMATENGMPSLKVQSGGAAGWSAAVHQGMSVRRLTPRECERLMGWPRDHTRYRADGREIPDGPRYRLCGNGVVSNVAEWIARRAALVLVGGG